MASGTTLSLLVVLIIFFSIGFGLYAIATTESPAFFATTMSGGGPTGDTVPGPSSLIAWNVTNAIWLNSTHQDQTYDITGWSWTYWHDVNDTGPLYIGVESYDLYFGFLYLNREDFKWYNTSTGNLLSVRPDLATGYSGYWTGAVHDALNVSLLDTLYSSRNLTSDLTFRCTNSKGSMQVSFDFNTTTYANPTAALQPGAQGVFLSLYQDFSDRRTSINLISFIGSLFVFSPPGVPYPVSTIISGLWYGCVGALSYVIVAIIRSFIPLLGGGD